MNETPIGFRFIVALKQGNNKQLTQTISNIFKIIYLHVECFHNKSQFFSNSK